MSLGERLSRLERVHPDPAPPAVVKPEVDAAHWRAFEKCWGEFLLMADAAVRREDGSIEITAGVAGIFPPTMDLETWWGPEGGSALRRSLAPYWRNWDGIVRSPP